MVPTKLLDACQVPHPKFTVPQQIPLCSGRQVAECDSSRCIRLVWTGNKRIELVHGTSGRGANGVFHTHVAAERRIDGHFSGVALLARACSNTVHIAFSSLLRRKRWCQCFHGLRCEGETVPGVIVRAFEVSEMVGDRGQLASVLCLVRNCK